ncbi:MAG: single-stranded DNA-binding protein [Microthrixaceae bacterium]|nr:single-stranded DNA-binding protein [Microthrixaceae bacterium]MCO5311486.1 single-stranded DNA-binding protein [Microthrixaceae bacterium]HPB45846.1 single-stranded DNA-binding protein [Microthrixaceae bacterium]
MANGNNVDLVGNVTRDPELRFTPSGQAVATFGLAVNRRWQNRQNQQWEESTSFFDIVCWGQLGENVAESVARGTRLIVTGRLEQRSWESQEGEKRSKIEVIADEVGPSLRWATASVIRNERQGGGSFDGGGGGGGGSFNAAPAPTPNAPAATYDYEEEPF